jgi:hypothetical protein
MLSPATKPDASFQQGLYDRIQRGDLMQASVVMASFVYHTAMREEKLSAQSRCRSLARSRTGNNSCFFAS